MDNNNYHKEDYWKHTFDISGMLPSPLTGLQPLFAYLVHS